ncbi:hypothetical protein LZ005_20840 [Massilia sp. TS11]|nr:hypothetical protein [Massilia sp. TS11]
MPAYYAVTQAGFERSVPTAELRSGLELVREFVDRNGKPVSTVKVGDELTVVLKFRAVGRNVVPNVALVDLLPGGFEPVLDTPNATPEAAPAATSVPLAGLAGASSNRWNLTHADAREDRVLFYGAVSQELGEIRYRIKATNSGSFVVPPAYAESMYERKVQARTAAGQRLTVEAADKP